MSRKLCGAPCSTLAADGRGTAGGADVERVTGCAAHVATRRDWGQDVPARGELPAGRGGRHNLPGTQSRGRVALRAPFASCGGRLGRSTCGYLVWRGSRGPRELRATQAQARGDRHHRQCSKRWCAAGLMRRYLTAGFYEKDDTIPLLLALQEGGADVSLGWQAYRVLPQRCLCAAEEGENRRTWRMWSMCCGGGAAGGRVAI